MLDYIKGKITKFGDTFIIIETGGMGIKVIATQNTIEKLKKENKEDSFVNAYLHISENKWEVFGFAETREREAFLLLLECRGVGTKAALNILNSFSPTRLRRIALGQEPVTTLQQAPGIGAKSADRILVELKEKLPEMGGWTDEKKEEGELSAEYTHDDVFRALQNLGYRHSEIQTAISRMPELPPTLSEAVKQLLRAMGKG